MRRRAAAACLLAAITLLTAGCPAATRVVDGRPVRAHTCRMVWHRGGSTTVTRYDCPTPVNH